MMDDSFLRNRMLLGNPAVEALARAHVCVVGVGGVGGWAAEGLTRAGVGRLTLWDHDSVAVTNINRQCAALHSTLGQPKAQAMAERVRDINPRCDVTAVARRYEPDSRELFFSERYDYIIDAIDIVSNKLDLIESSISHNIPVISALGTGNKLNPERLRVTDITQTHTCPLARVVRKELRARGIIHHSVLWSDEEPHSPEDLEAPPPGRRSVPASIPWVPACAGFMLAGEAVRRLADRRSVI